MTGLRIALAADEAIGQRTLRMLVRSEHSVVLVATPTSVEGNSSLRDQAAKLGITTVDAKLLGQPNFADELACRAPDVLLNIHSLTKVCSQVLDAFSVGAWNLHPGALPEAAGINVPSWAIALGWAQHGVSLHWMTAEYDAGHVAYQDRFTINPAATGLTLSAECASRGLRLVSRLIDQLADNPSAVPAYAQDASQRQYYGRGQPNDGHVDWTDTATSIEAHVRAADFRPFPSPWSAPRAKIGDDLFELVEVQLGDVAAAPPGTPINDPSGWAIAAADRWVNVIDARKVLQA